MSDVLDRVLTGMEFPATTDDLLREAARRGCDPEALSLLRRLPNRSYHGVTEVKATLRRMPQEANASK